MPDEKNRRPADAGVSSGRPGAGRPGRQARPGGGQALLRPVFSQLEHSPGPGPAGEKPALAVRGLHLSRLLAGRARGGRLRNRIHRSLGGYRGGQSPGALSPVPGNGGPLSRKKDPPFHRGVDLLRPFFRNGAHGGKPGLLRPKLPGHPGKIPLLFRAGPGLGIPRRSPGHGGRRRGLPGDGKRLGKLHLAAPGAPRWMRASARGQSSSPSAPERRCPC